MVADGFNYKDLLCQKGILSGRSGAPVSSRFNKQVLKAAIQARNEPAKNTGDDEPDEEYVISDNNILMSNRAL